MRRSVSEPFARRSKPRRPLSEGFWSGHLAVKRPSFSALQLQIPDGTASSIENRATLGAMMRTKMIAAMILAAIASLMLGCSHQPKLECSSPEATSATSDLVREAIEKATWKLLTASGQPSQVGHSKVRATIRQLLVSIEDIRTAKKDPNSTKRFCTGNLAVRIPADVLADADAARGDANVANLSALADQSDIDREADTFKASFDYDVQPTDSGDKVYAETTILPKFSDFFAQLVVSSLLKPVLEQAKVQQQQMAAAQQQQQLAAQNEKRQADLAQARADDELATQTISAVWKNIAPEQRTTLLPNQRAWIRKKAADCDVEAAGASTDPIEQQTARMKCDSRMTQERVQALRPFAGASPNPAFQ